MSLIDRHVPVGLFRERHHRRSGVSAAAVMTAARSFRPEEDPLFRRLFALREIAGFARSRPRRASRRRAPPFGIDDFTLLDETADEIVYGLAGRLWRPTIELVPLADAPSFLAQCDPSTVKLALNLAVRPISQGRVELVTETRVACVDRAALVRFAPYWCVIRPVSGLLRRRMLAAICRAAEATSA